MKYIEVKIFADRQGVEPLSLILADLGIFEYVTDEEETCVTLYLDDGEQGRQALERVISAAGGRDTESRVVEDSDWVDKWKEFFRPKKISERIVVKPTWEDYTPLGDELVIEMDPGMAFGTGAHPTTSMCVRFMEKYAGQLGTVIDIGCGSGILSVAAGLLGAEKVVGIDEDPVAVAVSQENVMLNKLEDRVHISVGDLTKNLDVRADLIVANLMPDLIQLLVEDLHEILVPGGLFISSGILIEKGEQVRTAIKNAGFEIVDIMEEGEWCAFLHRRKISRHKKLL